MSDERIEINLNDDRHLPARVTRTPLRRNSARLVITAAELSSPSALFEPPADALPQMAKRLAQYSRAAVAHGALFGLIAALLAWAAAEVHGLPITMESQTDEMLGSGLWLVACFAVMACCLCAAERVVDGDWTQAARRGAAGLGIGAAGGFISHVFGLAAFSTLLGFHQTGLPALMPLRALDWGFGGILVGLALQVSGGRRNRLTDGIISGAVAGLAGGLLYDPVAGITGSLLLARGVAIVLAGVTVGAFIGLKEEKRKAAWLTIISGPDAGTRFTICQDVTRIGSAPRCEMRIPNDTEILPEHAVIETADGERVLHNVTLGTLPFVNGRTAFSALLQPGDIITLGATHLIYEERPAALRPD